MRMIPSALLVLLAGCAPKVEPPPATTAPAPAPELPAYAKDLVGSLDTTTPACDDFYQFACGGWLKSTTLPADKASWTRSFSVIREQNLAEMKTILEETAANPGTDPDRQKLGTYFGACMSEDAANSAGLTPLQPIVKEIDTIKDAAAFMEQVGKLQALGAQPFMQAYTDGDYKNPGTTILYLTQGGLSFPDKKYYDTTDANNAALLTELEALIAKDLERLGTKDAAALAKKVVAFESGIATAWIPREDVRDPTKTYHKIDRAGLLKLTPGLKWDKYLSGLGAGTAEQINVETPETFQKMEALVKKTDVATLKAYLKWQLIHGLAGSLDNETFNADFALFRGKVAEIGRAHV
jgi:predicted metalloendopeptidase